MHPGTSQLETSGVAEHNSAPAFASCCLAGAAQSRSMNLFGLWQSLTWPLGTVPPAGIWGRLCCGGEFLRGFTEEQSRFLGLPISDTHFVHRPSFLPSSFKSHCYWTFWRCQWGKTAWVCFWAPWVVAAQLRGATESPTGPVSEDKQPFKALPGVLLSTFLQHGYSSSLGL